MSQSFGKDPTENLRKPMSAAVISCKHGLFLYGTGCLNCEREKRKNKKHREAAKRINKAVKKLNW